jgi:hypothetical protein
MVPKLDFRPAAWVAAMPKATASCLSLRPSMRPAAAVAENEPTVPVTWKPFW